MSFTNISPFKLHSRSFSRWPTKKKKKKQQCSCAVIPILLIYSLLSFSDDIWIMVQVTETYQLYRENFLNQGWDTAVSTASIWLLIGGVLLHYCQHWKNKHFCVPPVGRGEFCWESVVRFSLNAVWSLGEVLHWDFDSNRSSGGSQHISNGEF